MNLLTQLLEIFLLGLVGGAVPGPMMTSVFAEVLGRGFARSLRVCASPDGGYGEIRRGKSKRLSVDFRGLSEGYFLDETRFRELKWDKVVFGRKRSQ